MNEPMTEDDQSLVVARGLGLRGVRSRAYAGVDLDLGAGGGAKRHLRVVLAVLLDVRVYACLLVRVPAVQICL